MTLHVDLWSVTAFDLKGRPLLVARRVFTRRAADGLEARWIQRGDVSRVVVAPDEPAPARGRSYR